MEKSKIAVDESSTVDYRNDAHAGVRPPAYDKPLPTTLKVARIMSVTLIALTAIVGVMVVIGIYIHNGYQCQCDNEKTAGSDSAPMTAARIDRMDREPMASENADKVIPLPVKLELDATLGNILKNSSNKKAEVNCVVETRKASQIISQDPKTLMTPFGNLTTDPRLLHFTGEKMTFSCISAVKGKKGSKKNKKPKGGPVARPRRSPEKMCACDCAC